MYAKNKIHPDLVPHKVLSKPLLSGNVPGVPNRGKLVKYLNYVGKECKGLNTNRLAVYL